MAMNVKSFVKELLQQIGEDPKREGLRKTPHRVEEVLSFLTDGYQQDLSTIVNDAIFKEKVDDMVIVKDINFFSLCEHHLLPFYGTCHIGYLPTGKVLGLGKFPRIVEMYMIIEGTGPSRFLNHSCSPNCYFEGRTLVTKTVVGEGQELTINYLECETTGRLRHPFKCKCKCSNCLHKIG